MAALTLALGILASSSGCCLFRGAEYYTPRMPVIPKPDRPQLQNIAGTEMQKMSPDAQKAVAGNINALMDYSRKLEVGIDGYNKFAAEKNEQFGPVEGATK